MRLPPSQWIGRFGLDTPPSPWSPRFNIAPTQQILAIRGGAGGRELVSFRWGLIPSWAKDPSIGSRMINARGETVAEKPSFRTAFRRRRCLVLADGYYEWKKEGKGKQPYHIHLPEGEVFAFAGLWERWSPDGDEPLETCTIITTAASGPLADLHDRMPVILDSIDYEPWLATPEEEAAKLLPLIAPFEGELVCDAVSTRVNSVKNDDPACLEGE